MNKVTIGVLMCVVLATSLAVGCGRDSDCEPSEIQNAELKVGDEAPDFRLPDHKGGFVRLSNLKGKSNAVLAFYPAAFTPV